MVQTRTPHCARSRASGSVMPTHAAPLEAEYASWPTWPSNAATEAVLTITPRSPSLDADGSASSRAMRAAASRITL